MPAIQQPRQPAQSPSVWREWIEIYSSSSSLSCTSSPSVWREWIEIVFVISHVICITSVSLRVEGVD